MLFNETLTTGGNFSIAVPSPLVFPSFSSQFSGDPFINGGLSENFQAKDQLRIVGIRLELGQYFILANPLLYPLIIQQGTGNEYKYAKNIFIPIPQAGEFIATDILLSFDDLFLPIGAAPAFNPNAPLSFITPTAINGGSFNVSQVGVPAGFEGSTVPGELFLYISHTLPML